MRAELAGPRPQCAPLRSRSAGLLEREILGEHQTQRSLDVIGSVQRYTKTHKLIEARSKLSTKQKQEGLSFFSDPVRVLKTAASQAPPSQEKRRFLESLRQVTARRDLTLSAGSFDGGQVDEPRIRQH